MFDITHRFIKTNGISLHVAESGDGPLVLLLHGWPELWYSWRRQLRALAEAGYHAVAPDIRGYGQSDMPISQEAYKRMSKGRCASSSRALHPSTRQRLLCWRSGKARGFSRESKPEARFPRGCRAKISRTASSSTRRAGSAAASLGTATWIATGRSCPS